MPNPEIVGLVGILTFFAGIFYTIKALVLSRTGIRTQATVINIENEEEWDEEEKTIIRKPILQFEDQNNNLIINRKLSNFSNTLGQDLKVGNQTSYLYHPESPEKGVIDSFWGVWSEPILCFFFSAICIWFAFPEISEFVLDFF